MNKLTHVLFLFLCRLALYVYEYLLHVGAQKSAQTFLSEVSHKHGVCVCVSTAHVFYVSTQKSGLTLIRCPVSVAAN